MSKFYIGAILAMVAAFVAITGAAAIGEFGGGGEISTGDVYALEPPADDSQAVALSPGAPPAGEGRELRPRQRGHRRGGWTIPKDQEAELLELIKTKLPDEYRQLIRLRTSRPLVYRRSLRRMWRWYLRVRDMSRKGRQAAVAQYKARRRLWQLMREIRDTSASEPLLKELRQVVTDQFEAEQTLRRERLAQLEKQILDIRKDIKARGAKRDEIVAQRVKHLLQAATKPPEARRRRHRQDDATTTNKTARRTEQSPTPANAEPVRQYRLRQ